MLLLFPSTMTEGSNNLCKQPENLQPDVNTTTRAFLVYPLLILTLVSSKLLTSSQRQGRLQTFITFHFKKHSGIKYQQLQEKLKLGRMALFLFSFFK